MDIEETKFQVIVTIDGPAGAGKSSVSKAVARALGFTYLDSGAMYRALALYMLEKGVDINDEAQVLEHLEDVEIRLENGAVYIDSRNVSRLIRTPEIDQASSAVSRFPPVRQRLTALQRKMGRTGNIVAEGRDMGTVVFPEADFKFFLTASPEERARRRTAQLAEKGKNIIKHEIILQQIKKRDKADSNRQVAPLRAAEDAFVIDSTNLGFDEVIEKILNTIREKRKKSGKDQTK